MTSAQRAANVLAASRGARLNDQWTALRAARNVERPARLEPAAGVLDMVDLGRIGVDAARLVEHKRVRLPAVPQFKSDLHEFVRPIVAQVVLEMRDLPEVQGLAVVHRGDHVPRRPPRREVVEGRELAGHVVGRAIGRRPRRPEADVPRHGRKRAEDRHRIHARCVLIAVADTDLVAAAEAVGDRQPIGEKQEVELSLLEHARDMRVVRERQEIGVVRGIAPDRMTVDHRTRDQEPAQMHFTARLAHGVSLSFWRLAQGTTSPVHAVKHRALKKLRSGSASRSVR
jgi:hypothetical protein